MAFTGTRKQKKIINKALDIIDAQRGNATDYNSGGGWSQGDWITTNDDEVLAGKKKANYLDGQYHQCGTYACLAGWVVLSSGDWKPQVEPVVLPSGKVSKDKVRYTGDIVSTKNESVNLHDAPPPGHKYASTSNWAAYYMGLESSNEDGWHDLFSAGHGSMTPHEFTDYVRVTLGMRPKWSKA